MRIRRPLGSDASPLPDGNDNRTEQQHSTISDTNTVDSARMTRAQRAVLPLSTEVIQALAEQHGICLRPMALRRIDTTTGRIDIVPVPCGSTRQDQCPSCADKARRLRMAQYRQGWHLDIEPIIDRAPPAKTNRS